MHTIFVKEILTNIKPSSMGRAVLQAYTIVQKCFAAHMLFNTHVSRHIQLYNCVSQDFLCRALLISASSSPCSVSVWQTGCKPDYLPVVTLAGSRARRPETIHQCDGDF